MYDFATLEYSSVFKIFKDLCGIPHGSGNIAQISDYCAAFAEKLGLSYTKDQLGNLIIRKPATAGYEQHPTVILQGHLDMVCEKDDGLEFDFITEGLKIDMQDDYIFAHGTSLGGDDGIAVAYCLATLQDTELQHPPLEIILTVDEEVGLIGAEAMDCSALKGKRMINIDSEEEGIFTVSCAGGAGALLTVPLKSALNNLPCYRVHVAGLKGGHSGVEIDKGRLNAAVLSGLFLKEIEDGRLISLQSGQKNNAIPLSAEFVVASARDLNALIPSFIEKYAVDTDPGLSVAITPMASADRAYSAEDTKKIAEFISTVPNGIITMSKDINGLVETSLNLGILKAEGDRLIADFSVRSSINNEKEKLLQRLREFVLQYNGEAIFSASYPAWEYQKNSALQKMMGEVWEKCFGAEPKIQAIHAGLECGFFCEKIEDLDAVSIGPNMQDIHTSREKLSISSSQRIYRFLIELLKQL